MREAWGHSVATEKKKDKMLAKELGEILLSDLKSDKYNNYTILYS